MHLCEHILGFNTAGYRHFTLDAAKEFCQKIAAGEIDPEALLAEFAAEDMAKAVRKAVTSFLPAKAAEKREAPTKSQGHQTRSGNVIRPAMTGRVLSVKALNTAPRGAVIVVPKGAIVTALASDEARRRGVTIQIES